MAASVGSLVVCCSVVFWALLYSTAVQVTAAPFSRTAGINQPKSYLDAPGGDKNIDRSLAWQRRKKRYQNYPVAEDPNGYDRSSGRLRDWDNNQFPGQRDYARNGIGPSGQYDPSGYRLPPGGYNQYGAGRDSRYDEFKKSQLWEQRGQNAQGPYNRRVEVPKKKIDTGSNTIYQPERIGVPKHVAGFWGDSPNGDSPTLREKGILQTLAKTERSGFHKIKPGGNKKVSTQFDRIWSNDDRKDEDNAEKKGSYPFEYDRENSRGQNSYHEEPYQGPQSQYQPPNVIPGSYNHPNIGSMLGQDEQGLKKGVPVDGMLLNLHEAPGLVPVPRARAPETADQTSNIAQEAPSQDNVLQPISNEVAQNTTEKEIEIPMPPKSKDWLEMHPEEIKDPSTTPEPAAAPTTTTLAIPMPPKSKQWIEEERLKEELEHRAQEKEDIERLEEVAHRLGTNGTSGSYSGNSSRYVTEEVQPDVDRQAEVEDTGDAADNSRVYLTREEYERLRQQAQLAEQRELMQEQQREQESYQPVESQMEEQGETSRLEEDTQAEVVNNTVENPESIKRDPTPEDIEKLRQAELEREREAMLEELENESAEHQQNNETQIVNQLEEGSQVVTGEGTGSDDGSIHQEEVVDARQSELENEREEMLQELVKEDLGKEKSETRVDQGDNGGLEGMAEIWDKMNSQKKRKKRSILDQYSDRQAKNYEKSARSGTEKDAVGVVNKGVAANNDMFINGHRIAMPAKKGNSYMKSSGKYESFPVHEVKTDRLGVPKAVAGFWEDTKKDDDKASSSSSSHMKVTLNKANSLHPKASSSSTALSNARKLADTKFYKSKGLDRLKGHSTYKKTPFEDVGRLSPFKDNPKPETKSLPVHKKYPVPPVQSSLPMKASQATQTHVAPEKIVSLESNVDNVPVPLYRKKIAVHNSVPHHPQRKPEYTSEQILPQRQNLLEDSLAKKVALAKSHSVNHYQTDHLYAQGNHLVKSPEKLVNESSSFTNETDIAYQFLNAEFYSNIMARYKSKDALWAALCIAVVLSVMFSAVWYSKMWRKKTGDWDLPGKYQPEAVSTPIKELIRQKLGRIPRLKGKLKRKRKGPMGHRYLQLKRKQSTGATSSEEEVMYKRL